MNPAHLDLCNSEEWAEVIRDQVVPWVLDGVELGDRLLEIGPGPGRTTDVIHRLVDHLTVVELDRSLADALTERFADTNVAVVLGDATALSFPDDEFSAAVSFTMLHHVPSAELQDRVLAELARVVRPGGWIAGEDSRPSDDLRDFHDGDTYVPIDPDTLPGRLAAAGWQNIDVVVNEYATRFRGTAPVSTGGGSHER
jgi:ubiquinone/menaquinone biosynthesis C-methylase UbiE